MITTKTEIRKQRWTTVDADWYHAGTGSYADRIDASVVESIVQNLKGRALDMPCGSGRINATLSRHMTTIGADYSESMLGHAVHTAGVTGVRSDAFQLAFRDESFQAIICLRLTFHYIDCAGILSELARVSSPGAQILVDSLNCHSTRWLVGGLWNRYRGNKDRGVVFRSIPQFQQQLESAGFRVVTKQSRYILPTRVYRSLPQWLCSLLTAIERFVPSSFRVLTFWHLEKKVSAPS